MPRGFAEQDLVRTWRWPRANANSSTYMGFFKFLISSGIPRASARRTKPFAFYSDQKGVFFVA